MKTFSTITFAFLIMCLAITKTHGQTSDQNLEMKSFGLGLHMQQFKISELDDMLMPLNKILFTINTRGGNFRIEPEIGLIYSKQKISNDYSVSSTGVELGIGMFDMYQIQRTNIYYGGRLNYGRIKQSSDHEWYESEPISTIKLGPAIGVEYYFGNHFSIGGEISIQLNTYKEDDYIDFFDEYIINTNTGLILRFYF